jgi:hypothetical protein
MSRALLQILHDVTKCRRSEMTPEKTKNIYIKYLAISRSIFKFRHPLTSSNNESSVIEFRDLENIDLAVKF